MKAVTKIFDGKPMRLDQVATGSDRRIRTVAVLNNTPYFLYIGREQNPTRETALLVIEPYTDIIQPVSEAQALHVVEGPAIGTIPANCQATVMWGAEVFAHGERRTSRNVVIPVMRNAPVKVGEMVSSNLTAQGLTDAQMTLNSVQTFAVPASARRRSLYVYGAVGNTVSGQLSGSIDKETWFKVTDVFSGPYALPDGLALPPYLRLDVSSTAATNASAYMVVDL